MDSKVKDDAAGAAALQRVDGSSHIRVHRAKNSTVLGRLRQEGAAKIRFPHGETRLLDAVLINTAGGLTGGDRLSWRLEAGTGSRVRASTPASEKIYRSVAGTASVKIRIDAQPQTHIAWLPQETILFNEAALEREFDAFLSENARLLMCETIIFGRAAHRETIRHVRLREKWRIYHDGNLVHAENQHIDGSPLFSLPACFRTEGTLAVSTVLLVSRDCNKFVEMTNSLIREAADVTGAASCKETGGTGKLLARIAAPESYQLRKIIITLVEMLNPEAGLPKNWTI